jgi:hypothetical protein
MRQKRQVGIQRWPTCSSRPSPMSTTFWSHHCQQSAHPGHPMLKSRHCLTACRHPRPDTTISNNNRLQHHICTAITATTAAAVILTSMEGHHLHLRINTDTTIIRQSRRPQVLAWLQLRGNLSRSIHMQNQHSQATTSMAEYIIEIGASRTWHHRVRAKGAMGTRMREE